MPKEILKKLPIVGLSACLAMVGLVFAFDWAVAVSLTVAFLAVAVPYFVARWRATSSLSSPLSVWRLKFSLVILFLCLSASVLSETGFLLAPVFVAGVVLAIIMNITMDVRTAMREV